MLTAWLQRLKKLFNDTPSVIDTVVAEESPAERYHRLSVLQNFVEECLNARKEPIDTRLVLFEDERYSHEQMITQLLEYSGRRVDATPTFSKAELDILLQQLHRELATKPATGQSDKT